MVRYLARAMAALTALLICVFPAEAVSEGNVIFLQEDSVWTAAAELLGLAVLFWKEAVAAVVAAACTVGVLLFVWKRKNIPRRKMQIKEISERNR